jgi:hypothetical protein
MSEGDLYATAIHEAGHAAIGRALGMVCGHATIEADEDSSGHVIVAEPYEIFAAWEQRGHHRDLSTVMVGRIMTFKAGVLAETEILGVCQGGDGEDRYQVACMMDDL